MTTEPADAERRLMRLIDRVEETDADLAEGLSEAVCDLVEQIQGRPAVMFVKELVG